jgi:hypothetical protein
MPRAKTPTSPGLMGQVSFGLLCLEYSLQATDTGSGFRKIPSQMWRFAIVIADELTLNRRIDCHN